MPITPPPALEDIIASAKRRIGEKKEKGGARMVVLFSQIFRNGDTDANSFKEHFQELGYSFSHFEKCRRGFWDIRIEW